MNVRYRVELSQDERDELTALLSGGKHAARKLMRPQILLAADAGASDEDIAISVAVGGSTVYRTERRFVEGNLQAALSEEPRPGAERKLSGKEEALLVATACSNSPEGRARWTLELLAGAMVTLTEIAARLEAMAEPQQSRPGIRQSVRCTQLAFRRALLACDRDRPQRATAVQQPRRIRLRGRPADHDERHTRSRLACRFRRSYYSRRVEGDCRDRSPLRGGILARGRNPAPADPRRDPRCCRVCVAPSR